MWGRCGNAGSSTPAAPGVVNTLPANTAQFPRSVLLSLSLEICSVPSRAHDLHAVTPPAHCPPNSPPTTQDLLRCSSLSPHRGLSLSRALPSWRLVLSFRPSRFSEGLLPGLSPLLLSWPVLLKPGLLSFFLLVSHLSASQLPLWRPAKCPLKK